MSAVGYYHSLKLATRENKPFARDKVAEIEKLLTRTSIELEMGMVGNLSLEFSVPSLAKGYELMKSNMLNIFNRITYKVGYLFEPKPLLVSGMITNISFKVSEGIDFTVEAFVWSGDNISGIATILNLNNTTTGINGIYTWHEAIKKICETHKLELDISDVFPEIINLPARSYVQTTNDWSFLRQVIKEELSLDYVIKNINNKLTLKVISPPTQQLLARKNAVSTFVLFKKPNFKKRIYPILSFEVTPQELIFLKSGTFTITDIEKNETKQMKTDIVIPSSSIEKNPVDPATNQSIEPVMSEELPGTKTLQETSTENYCSAENVKVYLNKQLPFVKVTFSTWGTFDLATGDVIEIDVGDPLFSTKYLITHLSHEISEGPETTIEAIKFTGDLKVEMSY